MNNINFVSSGCDQRVDDKVCSSQNNNHKYDVETSTDNTNLNIPPFIESKEHMGENHSVSNFNLILGIIVPLAMVITMLIWVLYAFRNPHTKSGQLLIQVF